MIKLDIYDKRLLYELDKNSKMKLQQLSKKLRRSKQFTLYRIKKLEEENIITGYNAIVDMSKLGYFTFRVYFKFQQTTIGDGKNFVKLVREKFKQVWTITDMHGKWDYALFLGVKKISEFHDIWDGIMLKYKPKIRNYNVAVYAPVYNFNRTFFLESSAEVIERVYGIGEKEELDELDWELIEVYANNVRQSSLEIAKKLKISPDTVRTRIRKLEQRKIITGYKVGLNLEPLGYVGYRVDLQLISSRRNKELFQFCKQHKNIYQINKSIGGADFETEVIVKNLNELLLVIDEIKTKFGDVVMDVDYFGFSTFHILQYIPD
ncbi:MAG TPA: Lrp/AsnC family transcriptional regulator [Candidatus Nanoarchaeia archaeon]|nr:Lrp/AsnC family transcriptional regulator [Candidatus Nanoarchaeia archaeon]